MEFTINNDIWEIKELESKTMKELYEKNMEEKAYYVFGVTQNEKENNEIIEDEFDEELPEEPKAKYGDVYQLGNHRLMCGDSTKIEDVEKLMNGKKADMVFTDSPYGYNYQSNSRTKSDKFNVLLNDDKILDFMKPLKLFNKGFVFICTTWKVLDKWIPLFNKYYDLTNMIIWNKRRRWYGRFSTYFLN